LTDSITAYIDEFLGERDNIEIIRDMLAYILKVECVHQQDLAEKRDVEDARDYKIGVYLEKERPWQLTEDEIEYNPFPLININLLQIKQADKPGSIVSEKKYIAHFAIDCYGCGNRTSGDNDQIASLRAWKTARIVRNILMAGCYTYLGLQSLVKSREITEIQAIVPSNRYTNTSSVAITVCRIILQVMYVEDSPQVPMLAEFEELAFSSISDTGEVLIP
jgi:hypothetical protein